MRTPASGNNVAPVDPKINSLAPVPEGEVAREVRLVVGDMEVENDQGRLPAKALGTYSVVSGG